MSISDEGSTDTDCGVALVYDVFADAVDWGLRY